jgi:RNA polymerase sigma-70 factor, ECF subfamily
MEPESLTRQLWQRAQAGDREAFEAMFAMHSSRLLVFIRMRMGDHLREKVEAEDVLQEAYMSALKGLATFEYTQDGAFLKWICHIIDNRLRDVYDYFMAQKRQAEPLVRSAPTGPVTALIRAEDRQAIEHALEQLSPEHREVLLLRYFQGLSAEEAGERMQRSAGAIRNLCARALVELGKGLAPERGSQS